MSKHPPHNRNGHEAFHPYPAHLVTKLQLADGTSMVIRPIRREDAEIEDEFVRNLSPESKYFRFMHTLHELTHEMLVRFTQIDYHREMAFIATTEIDGAEKEVAVGRYVADAEGESCEFALVVGDDWRGRGIGTRIMEALIEVARARGLRTMEGEILGGNANMLSLVRRLGFSIHACKEDPGIQHATRVL